MRTAMKGSKARSGLIRGRRSMHAEKPKKVGFSKAAAELARIGKDFYARGWVLETSGNFSAVISREPLRLAMTSTGLGKRALTPAEFVEIDSGARVLRAR